MKKIALLLVFTLLLSIMPASLAEEAPTKLSILLGRNAAVNVEWENNEMLKYVQELFNVEFEFLEIDNSAFNERFNVMLAGGDVPGIVTKRTLARDVVKDNIETGLFVGLNDYAEYIPNYLAFLENTPGMKELAYLPDGTLGGFAQQQSKGSPLTPILPTNIYFMNQAWLEKLNLEMPTTTEELYNVLVAFKTQDPNGNGVADEIPYAPLYGQSSLKVMANMFGLPMDNSSNYCYPNAEGKVEFLANTENYKAFLKFFNRLYAEGLMDNEVFTQTQQQVVAKGSGEVQLIGSSTASGAALVAPYDYNDYAFAPMIHSENSEPLWTKRAPGFVFTAVITKNCENIEKALQIFDYFYTEEGSTLIWMGIEGTSYAYDENGNWNWIFEGDETVTSVRAKYTMQPGGSIPSAVPNAWLKINDPSEQWFFNNNGGLALSNPDAFVGVYPTVTYGDREKAELSTYATDITEYVDQMMAEFIAGRKDIDAEWESYCATIEKMGLADMISIMQAGYDAL